MSIRTLITLARLSLVLLVVVLVWRALNHRDCPCFRRIRYIGKQELPRWWHIDWPEATRHQITTPPLPGQTCTSCHDQNDRKNRSWPPEIVP